MEVEQALTLLELPNNFDEKDLDKAFRRKSLQYHPDRIGGSSELFSELNEAFGLLKELPDLSDIVFMQTMFSGINNNYYQEPQSAQIEELSNSSSEKEPIMKYTIPITIKDYYYNKGKRIKVLNNKNEEVVLTYFPCQDKKHFKEHNILFKTRITDDDEDMQGEYAIDSSNMLIRYWKVSLSEFLYEEDLKVRVFNEEITVKRQIGGSHDLISYITERDMNIIVDGHGFYDNDKEQTRGLLLIKLIVLISREDLEDNKKNVKDAFSYLNR